MHLLAAMTDELLYEARLKKLQQEYEALCKHCGACCGVFEKDPCAKLEALPDGTFRCSDYENRFGLQRTINGNVFKCVSFRKIRGGSWAGSWRCGYVKTQGSGFVEHGAQE